MNGKSYIILNRASVWSGEIPKTFVMAGWFPLQIKLVDFLSVFSFYHLSYELELFAEFQNRFLENSNLPRRPPLKYRIWGRWVY